MPRGNWMGCPGISLCICYDISGLCRTWQQCQPKVKILTQLLMMGDNHAIIEKHIHTKPECIHLKSSKKEEK